MIRESARATLAMLAVSAPAAAPRASATWGALVVATLGSAVLLGVFFAIARRAGRGGGSGNRADAPAGNASGLALPFGSAVPEAADAGRAWELLRNECHIFGSTGWNRNVENLAGKVVDEAAVEMVHGGFRKSRRNFLYGTNYKLTHFAALAETVDPEPWRSRAFLREADRLQRFLTGVDEAKLEGKRLVKTSVEVRRRAQRIMDYVDHIERLVTDHFFTDLEAALRRVVYGDATGPPKRKPDVEVVSPAPEEKIWLAVPDAAFRAAVMDAIARTRDPRAGRKVAGIEVEAGVRIAYAKVADAVVVGINGPGSAADPSSRETDPDSWTPGALRSAGASVTLETLPGGGTTIEIRIPLANPAHLPGRLASGPG